MWTIVNSDIHGGYPQNFGKFPKVFTHFVQSRLTKTVHVWNESTVVNSRAVTVCIGQMLPNGTIIQSLSKMWNDGNFIAEDGKFDHHPQLFEHRRRSCRGDLYLSIFFRKRIPSETEHVLVFLCSHINSCSP